MKVYEIYNDVDNKFARCMIDEDECHRRIGDPNAFAYDMGLRSDGTSKIDGWWKRKLILCKNDDGTINRPGDFVGTGGAVALLLERHAVEKMKNVLENSEILPVDCEFGDYFYINPLTVLDCFDYEKSEYSLVNDKLIDDGRPFIFQIKKYALKKDIVEGHVFFKIYDRRRAVHYASDKFVEEYNKHKLTGLEFKLIWEG